MSKGTYRQAQALSDGILSPDGIIYRQRQIFSFLQVRNMVGELSRKGVDVLRRRGTLEREARKDGERSGGSGSGHDSERWGMKKTAKG